MPKPNKKLNNYIRSLPTDGSAGDINQITDAFLGNPQPQPTAPVVQKPKPPKPPKQPVSTQSQTGKGVRQPKKRRAKVRSSDLTNKREDTKKKTPSPLSIGAAGTGLNIGAY